MPIDYIDSDGSCHSGALPSGPIRPRAVDEPIDITVLYRWLLPRSADYKNPFAPHKASKNQIPFMSTMHPTLFLPMGFRQAVTVLLAIIPVRLC